MILKAVLFDLIGTTVKEKDPDAMNNCFVKSFTDNGFNVSADAVKANRGRAKLEIIDAVSIESGIELKHRDKINNSFKINFAASVNNFEANEGIIELLLFLKNNNIKAGLGTGLSRDLFDLILNNLKWDYKIFDYISNAEEAGGGRPNPAMIYDMINKLNITGPEGFLKVGDTISDIQEGKNAGVKTAVILSGTQSKEILTQENPDYLLNSLNDIKILVDGH